MNRANWLDNPLRPRLTVVYSLFLAYQTMRIPSDWRHVRQCQYLIAIELKALQAGDMLLADYAQHKRNEIEKALAL